MAIIIDETATGSRRRSGWLANAAGAVAGVLLQCVDAGEKAEWPRGLCAGMAVGGLVLIAVQLHAISCASVEGADIAGAWLKSSLCIVAGVAVATIGFWLAGLL